MAPTARDMWAYVDAVKAYREYEYFGLPYPGTIRDQPAIWRLAVECVRDGANEARAQASAEAAKKSKEN